MSGGKPFSGNVGKIDQMLKGSKGEKSERWEAMQKEGCEREDIGV